MIDSGDDYRKLFDGAGSVNDALAFLERYNEN
jgi:hypothetical protein